jgi:hypothetical protein
MFCQFIFFFSEELLENFHHVHLITSLYYRLHFKLRLKLYCFHPNSLQKRCKQLQHRHPKEQTEEHNQKVRRKLLPIQTASCNPDLIQTTCFLPANSESYFLSQNDGKIVTSDKTLSSLKTSR